MSTWCPGPSCSLVKSFWKPYETTNPLGGSRLVGSCGPGRGQQSGGLDWSAWQRMPVLEDGRIMPLDSFARAVVKQICDDVRPSLGKLGAKTRAEMSGLSPGEIHRLAVEGRPRRFLAAELIYSWTVEPEKWDDVPFLIAEDASLRSDVLGVPLRGEDGSRLKHVSPRQVRRSEKFDTLAAEVDKIVDEAEEKQQTPELSPLQESVRKLDVARELFRELSYDPGRAGEANRSVVRDFIGIQQLWDGFARDLSRRPSLTVQAENFRLPEGDRQASQRFKEKLEPCVRAVVLEREFFQLAEKTETAMQEFVAQWGPVETGRKPVRSVESAAARLRRLSSDLDAKMRELAALDLPDPAFLVEDNRDEIRSNRQIFSRWTSDLALQAAQLPWALYAAGNEAISIVPALEPTALEADRYRSEIRPWISLHALLLGPPKLLRGYPAEDVEKIRAAWNDARVAYFHHGDPQGAGQFAEAIGQFTADVRALSEAIEPDRQQLPIIERERAVLAKTAYPAVFVTDAEVLYNRIDPFFWSGCSSLAAVCILGLSLLGLRKPLFWTGIAMMLAGVALVAGGFTVRMYITRWAPVTSMFETIVWVTMCISLLTLWVTFLPLLGPTSKAAWGLTAIPGSWEDRGSKDKRRREATVTGPPPTSQAGVRAVALAVRLALFLAGSCVGLCYMGVIQPISGGSGYHLASILPQADLGSSMPNLSASLVWAASMFVATMFVWYLPRLIPSMLLAIPMSLALAGRAEAAERMEKIYRLRVVALGGTVASLLAALAALYAPFPKDIEALNPVLRSNFWLGIHVLTITTSYAGAGVAWMIGNLALGYFAFGRYRTVDGERLPPAFGGTLAAMNYRVLQVTVLLLAAGTILGGLWADVSWGRFWGWDPKEVGALIALLIILTALHGRRAGWHGDLSLAIGAIWGFGGVIWAWYVVNFILKAGLHAYGGSEDGQLVWLVATVAVQALFTAIAVTRVMLETGQPAAAGDGAA